MMTFFFFFCLCLSLVLLIYKLWWTPIHVQNMLSSQGLKGQSNKFIHGSTKEIRKMREEALATPYDFWQQDLFPRILPHFHTWMKLYGNNFLIWIGHQPQIIVSEPELVKEILINKEGVHQKLKRIGHMKKLLGDWLIAAAGEKWSRLRKLTNHAFHGEGLKDMVPAMVASVDSMLEKWGYHEGKEIEVAKEFKLLTSDVISRTAFGNSYLEGKSIFELMAKLSVLIARNAFKIKLLGLEKIWGSKDDTESDEIERSLRDSIL